MYIGHIHIHLYCTLSSVCKTLAHIPAPEDVAAPQALQDIDALTIIWSEPGKPNGIITGYFVYMDGELIYTGGERMINITDLQVLICVNKIFVKSI